MTQTLKKFRLVFGYEATGQVSAQFNTDMLTEEQIADRLLNMAVEDYPISRLDISGYQLKEIES